MELGGEENSTINLRLLDQVEIGTAVHSLIDQPVQYLFKSNESSPEKLHDQDEALDERQDPIWDSMTVSSKKYPSTSPPNQRHAAEEISGSNLGVKRRWKKSLRKAQCSYEQSEARPKKNKNNSGKKRKRNYESIAKTKAAKAHFRSGRWTRLEHFKFLEALKMFGKEWQKVQQHVYTRTSTQARSHAQKFFVKLEKKELTLEEFLNKLDIEQLKVDLNIGVEGDSTDYDESQPLLRIANQKLNSVMNIALPDSKPPSKIAQQLPINSCGSPNSEHVRSTVRSTKQRRAKLNHTSLHNKHLSPPSESRGSAPTPQEAITKESILAKGSSHLTHRVNFKRRKTDIMVEEETKIRIDRSLVQEYNLELRKETQEGRKRRDYAEEQGEGAGVELGEWRCRDIFKDLNW